MRSKHSTGRFNSKTRKGFVDGYGMQHGFAMLLLVFLVQVGKTEMGQQISDFPVVMGGMLTDSPVTSIKGCPLSQYSPAPDSGIPLVYAECVAHLASAILSDHPPKGAIISSLVVLADDVQNRTAESGWMSEVEKIRSRAITSFVEEMRNKKFDSWLANPLLVRLTLYLQRPDCALWMKKWGVDQSIVDTLESIHREWQCWQKDKVHQAISGSMIGTITHTRAFILAKLSGGLPAHLTYAQILRMGSKTASVWCPALKMAALEYETMVCALPRNVTSPVQLPLAVHSLHHKLRIALRDAIWFEDSCPPDPLSYIFAGLTDSVSPADSILVTQQVYNFGISHKHLRARKSRQAGDTLDWRLARLDSLVEIHASRIISGLSQTAIKELVDLSDFEVSTILEGWPYWNVFQPGQLAQSFSSLVSRCSESYCAERLCFAFPAIDGTFWQQLDTKQSSYQIENLFQQYMAQMSELEYALTAMTLSFQTRIAFSGNTGDLKSYLTRKGR